MFWLLNSRTKDSSYSSKSWNKLMAVITSKSDILWKKV